MKKYKDRDFDLTFLQLEFFMGGTGIIVRQREYGEYGELLYKGTVEELHTDINKELRERIQAMEVISVAAEDNNVLIGVADPLPQSRERK